MHELYNNEYICEVWAKFWAPRQWGKQAPMNTWVGGVPSCTLFFIYWYRESCARGKKPSFLNTDFSEYVDPPLLASLPTPNRPHSHAIEVMIMTRAALNKLKLKRTVLANRARSWSTHDWITLFRVAGLRTTPMSCPPLRGSACALSRYFCAAAKAAYLNPKVYRGPGHRHLRDHQDRVLHMLL